MKGLLYAKIFSLFSRKKINFPKNPIGFWNYFFCFLMLLLFSFCWGIYFSTNIHILVYGMFINGFCFYFLIKIKYPFSLRSSREKEVSFLNYCKKNQKQLGLLVFSLVISYVVFFCIFYYIDVVVGFVTNYPENVLAILWIFFVSFITVIIIKYKDLILYSKNKFFKLYLNRPNRKILLFFRKQPHALSNPVVVYLGVASFFSNTPVFSLFFYGLSFKYHQGVEVYFWLFSVMLITLIVTTPFFRNYIFSQYGPKSLQLLIWNGPEVNGLRVVLAATSAAAATITVGYLDHKVSRANAAEQAAHDRLLRHQHNAEVDAIREKDPVGFEKGRYVYASLPDPSSTGPKSQKSVSKVGQTIFKVPEILKKVHN